MKKVKIGITNGVYREEGYNHFKTLELASGRIYPFCRVDLVQSYLNPQNIENFALLEQISERAKEYELELITHIHGLPKEEELDKVIDAHARVLEYQDDKRAVIHYEPLRDELMKVIKKFNESSITVYVENFHRGISGRELEKHDKFVDFVLDNSQKYDLGAVIDFPRYFVDEAETEEKVEEIIKKITTTYHLFAERDILVFFHTIGTRRPKEQGREDWAAQRSQEDLIPQERILKEVLSGEEGILVLESEKVEHVVEGMENIKKWDLA